ncbi:MAG: DUF3667 domain-containing protein [Caulobacter sp.]|nr:DUF3667 domain-containing protein [Caulobacter sp.]
MDLDSAAGLATAGVIAGAIEKPTGIAGEHSDGHCRDCGAPVAGRFCSTCGQPVHVHRTLLHLGEEFLHGIVHFDARVWRTLPLLALDPGRLTREWVQGRRTRYVSPLALFLFTVFLMFFLMSFGGASPIEMDSLPERLTAGREALVEARAEAKEADRVLARAQAAERTSPSDETSEARNEAEVAARGVHREVAALEKALETLQATAKAGPRSDGLEPGSLQAQIADAAKAGKIKVNMGNEELNHKILKKLSNPDLALYKLQQTLYKFAFLIVPLSIPFVALLFLWKRGFTLYDHGVFVLYSLTFMAIAGMVLGLLEGIKGPLTGPAEFLSGLLLLSLPVHMFLQLKGAYDLKIFSALWRTLLLLFFCVLVLTLFMIAIVLLGLGG